MRLVVQRPQRNECCTHVLTYRLAASRVYQLIPYFDSPRRSHRERFGGFLYILDNIIFSVLYFQAIQGSFLAGLSLEVSQDAGLFVWNTSK